MKSHSPFPLIIIAMMFLAACTTTQTAKTVEDTPAIENTPVTLPIEQQQELAMNIFNGMLNMTGEHSRKEVLPQLIEGYEQIIKEAPDTVLAEESHLYLITHYFEDPKIPQVDNAEEVYRQYFERYKKPRLAPAINSTLARLYYNYRMWDRLSNFLIPFMKEYIETGTIADKIYFFYFAEAKYYLKEYDEAAKGYRLMIREHPPKVELEYAHKRLKEIRQLRDPSKTKEQ